MKKSKLPGTGSGAENEFWKLLTIIKKFLLKSENFQKVVKNLTKSDCREQHSSGNRKIIESDTSWTVGTMKSCRPQQYSKSA